MMHRRTFLKTAAVAVGMPAIVGATNKSGTGNPIFKAGDRSYECLHDWAKLPVPREQFARELEEQLRLQYRESQPMDGAEQILSNSNRAHSADAGDKIVLVLVPAPRPRHLT